MRTKLGAVCMALGGLCILGALTLLLHNRNEDQRAARAVAAALPQVREAIARHEALPTPSAPPAEEEPEEMEESVVDGYSYIGYLAIPTLELELPVMSQWDAEGLKLAPCRQFGAVGSNDMVIAGHNYKSHFGPLHRLNVGEQVAFTAIDGSVYTYEVGTVDAIAATAVEEVKNSEWDLVLYTCTLGGKERVAVGCVRI